MKARLPLVYSCLGCSSTAQMANARALRFDREGVAGMSCIGGAGGGLAGLVRIARSGRPILALDGCAPRCVGACLTLASLGADGHVQRAYAGLRKKARVDFDRAPAEAVHACHVRAAPNERRAAAGTSETRDVA